MSDICPHCKFTIPSGEKRCPSCGIDIFEYAPDKMRCPLCKEMYPKGTKFCLKDGSPLESGEIDFSSEATMFLTPNAIKKTSKPPKSPSEDLSDQDRIPIFQSHKQEDTPHKKEPKPQQYHPAHKQELSHEEPFSISSKTNEPPKPTVDDAFELFQALTGDEKQSPVSSKIPTATPHQPAKPHAPEPPQIHKTDISPHDDSHQKEHPKLEMTPELLAAKRKLEEKYSKGKPLKKPYEQPRVKSLAEYEKLLSEDEETDEKMEKPQELEIKPIPVMEKPGFWTRIKMAIRVLFPKW